MTSLEESTTAMLTVDGVPLETKEPVGKAIRQGYLKKKSPKGFPGFRKWQSRWFMLYRNQLVYYKNETDLRPAGKIYFSMIDRIVKGDNFDQEYRIDILCTAQNTKRGREKRTFCLRAYDKAEGDSWYKAMVNCALGKEREASTTRQFGHSSRPSIQPSPEKIPSIGGLYTPPAKVSRTSELRRATEVKADSRLLGTIKAYDELVSESPDLGNVYRARIGSTKRKLFLQTIPKENEKLVQKYVPLFKPERLQILRSRYIMPILGIGQTSDCHWILYDYGGNYSLFRFIQRTGGFPERAARSILAQVLLALQEVHKRNFTCWNLSPESIYLDGDGNVLLCDLQLGIDPGDRDNLSTNEYSVPEVFQGGKYSRASDWWKFGILLFELLFGIPPTWTESHDAKDIAERVIALEKLGIGDCPINISEDAKELLKMLLVPIEERKKLTFLKVQQSGFFRGINFTQLRRKGRQETDEWWQKHICSFCECNYVVYSEGEIKSKTITPAVVDIAAVAYFEGLKIEVNGVDIKSSETTEKTPPPPPKIGTKGAKGPEHKKTITNIIRGVVGKNFNRYRQDGYDLDLAYITDRIMAMGYPSLSGEGVYRNPLNDVKKLFKEKHNNAVKVYNLCLERNHEEGTFAYQEHISIEDHNPWCFKRMLEFCEDVHCWLKTNSSRVIAVHCTTGKGRTGMAIAAYLTFSQTCANADESLKLYAEKRTKDMKGVTLPSQRRYVLYFEQFLRTYYWPRPSAPMFQWRKPAIIQHVRLSPVPSYCEGCDPYFHVFHEGRVRLYDSTQHNDPMRCKVKTDKTVELLCNCPLQGDIKVVFYERGHATQGGEDTHMFSFWFHTSFIVNDYLCLGKSNLDGAASNKKNFTEDFRCEVFFVPDNEDVRSIQRTLEEVEMQEESTELPSGSERKGSP